MQGHGYTGGRGRVKGKGWGVQQGGGGGGVRTVS